MHQTNRTAVLVHYRQDGNRLGPMLLHHAQRFSGQLLCGNGLRLLGHQFAHVMSQEIQALFQTTADVSVRNQAYQLTLCIHYRSSAKTLVGNNKERFLDALSQVYRRILLFAVHDVGHLHQQLAP